MTNALIIYFSILAALFVAFSLWIGFSFFEGKPKEKQNDGGIKAQLKFSQAVLIELVVCSLGYSVFSFVMMLAIGIAIWLVLLGVVYLPADLLNNVFGDQWTRNIVNSISPYVTRSWKSPGLIHQPILDYSTLCVLFLAPAAGMWTVFKKYKRKHFGQNNGNHRDIEISPRLES